MILEKSLILEYLNGFRRLYSGDTEQGRNLRAYYRWVLKTGQLFIEKGDVKNFRKTFNKRFKGCYYNAQVMTIKNEKLKYYEGWGVSKAVGFPIEHGFNVAGRKVIDISWKDGVEYFWIEIPVDFAREEMLRTSTVHPILYLWWRKIAKEVK